MITELQLIGLHSPTYNSTTHTCEHMYVRTRCNTSPTSSDILLIPPCSQLSLEHHSKLTEQELQRMNLLAPFHKLPLHECK